MPETCETGQPVGDPVQDWSARGRPRRLTLAGRYVELVPVTADHAAALYAALCGPQDASLWTYRFAEPPADAVAMARLLRGLADDPSSVTWAVRPRPASGAEPAPPAGMLSATAIEPDHGRLEIGSVIFGRGLQRTRAATEALHLVLAHALDDLGYRRVEWKCDSLNGPSRAAALRLGFRYEGTFRRHLVVKGRNRDTAWFAVTDADWPALRAAHRSWLDPANFDADGTQRSALGRLVLAAGVVDDGSGRPQGDPG